MKKFVGLSEILANFVVLSLVFSACPIQPSFAQDMPGHPMTAPSAMPEMPAAENSGGGSDPQPMASVIPKAFDLAMADYPLSAPEPVIEAPAATATVSDSGVVSGEPAPVETIYYDENGNPILAPTDTIDIPTPANPNPLEGVDTFPINPGSETEPVETIYYDENGNPIQAPTDTIDIPTPANPNPLEGVDTTIVYPAEEPFPADDPNVDTDGDGIIDLYDPFPNTANLGNPEEVFENLGDPANMDADGDGIEDAMDNDIDGDGVPNDDDFFPLDPTQSVDMAAGAAEALLELEGPAAEEPLPENLIPLDFDGDGLPDDMDLFPSDPFNGQEPPLT